MKSAGAKIYLECVLDRR